MILSDLLQDWPEVLLSRRDVRQLEESRDTGHARAIIRKGFGVLHLFLDPLLHVTLEENAFFRSNPTLPLH